MATNNNVPEVVQAAANAANNLPAGFGEMMAWLTGLFAVIAGGRQVFKGVKSDVYEVNRIESDQAGLKRRDDEIRAKDYKIAALELKMKKLRDVELEGAADIAIIGVWIKQLADRTCPCIETKMCCATVPTKYLNEAHNRVLVRREEKNHIFAEDELPTYDKEKYP